MLRFTVRRLLNMLFVLFAISVLTFVVFNVIPGGDPAARMAGKNQNKAVIESIREDFGFNDPLPVQYWEMMKKAGGGELISYSNRLNVQEEILRGIPVTASLVVGAAAVWVFFGVLFGLLSAMYSGRFLDRALTVLALIGISMPVFWVGAVLLYNLAYKLPLFPAGGYIKLTDNPLDWAYHLVLPWFALSLLFIGFYSRLLRSNILDTENEDYIRTARAKGLSERRILLRHTLRNALIPIVTLFGLDFAQVFGGGAILTETVFDLEGVGKYAADSIGGLDLPPIMGVVLYGAFFIVFLNTLVDLIYAYLDPRIRLNA